MWCLYLAIAVKVWLRCINRTDVRWCSLGHRCSSSRILALQENFLLQFNIDVSMNEFGIFCVSTSDRVSDLMEALIPSVSFLPPQATSREERKRDFEKIFAHYDVVSSTGMCWVYNWAVMLQYFYQYTDVIQRKNKYFTKLWLMWWLTIIRPTFTLNVVRASELTLVALQLLGPSECFTLQILFQRAAEHSLRLLSYLRKFIYFFKWFNNLHK